MILRRGIPKQTQMRGVQVETAHIHFGRRFGRQRQRAENNAICIAPSCRWHSHLNAQTYIVFVVCVGQIVDGQIKYFAIVAFHASEGLRAFIVR